MSKTSRIVPIAGLAALSVIITACGGSRMNQNQYEEQVVDETYVHRYGVAVPSDFWTSAGEHGAVVSTMADGVVVTKGYSAGTLDGDTTYTYPHSSQIQRCESYQMGTLSKETEFYYDGTPKKAIVYCSPSPEMTTITTWYLTGTPRSAERYSNNRLISAEYFTSLNQRDALVEDAQGTRLVRDDHGQLTSTDTIQEGQMVLRHTYHANGSPKEIIPYRNERIDGVKRTYLQAGEPDTVEQWASGQQEGTTVVYQHGEKFAEIPYVSNVKHGIECRYRDGETKVQEVSWNAGNLHGPTKTYVGDNVKTEWFYKGQTSTKSDYELMTTRPIIR